MGARLAAQAAPANLKHAPTWSVPRQTPCSYPRSLGSRQPAVAGVAAILESVRREGLGGDFVPPEAVRLIKVVPRGVWIALAVLGLLTALSTIGLLLSALRLRREAARANRLAGL